MDGKNGEAKRVDSSWFQNWQREVEGVYLYRTLARLARTDELRSALEQMAAAEERHAALWSQMIREVDQRARAPRIDLRIRLVALIARLFGVESVMGLLLNDEVSDISTYAAQARRLGYQDAYRQVLTDETAHARAIQVLRRSGNDGSSEPWHRGASAGGLLRNMVYGFNDGLTANFGLVMGVVGANVNPHFILLTGFAGLLADALSMAASGFLAARSELEVRQHHLALEEAELRLLPKEEKEELVGIYASKGLTRQEASIVAERLLANPEEALTQLAREELGIDPDASENPLREGLITGIATGLGAVIPILPFLFLGGAAAIWIGVFISMLAHFLVGASRAVFTGRPALRSGFDMFVVGMGVAIVTYVLGLLVGVKL
jgi:VIT1/CCC1 family predicted Fe2+/Mn2+ transporter/rubrerythrin